MGKIKVKSRGSGSRDILHSTNSALIKSKPRRASSSKPIEDLLSEATELLEQGQAEQALPLVEDALHRLERARKEEDDIDLMLQDAADGKATLPQTLVLAANTQLALGNADTAQELFIRASHLDPDGALVSAEPWLWLSQLSDQGGRESILHFEKACEIIRNEIEVLTDADNAQEPHHQSILDERKAKLADALCGMTEIYMTDLSWEDDAEAHCESLITEAVAVCPDDLSASVLQTLASVRISQERIQEAKQALARSMSIWEDLPLDVENPARPDFATRVSLARLLMEVEAEADALHVLDRLVKEDDQSVESWYLGAWCRVLLRQKTEIPSEEQSAYSEQARTWLRTCLRLYHRQGYEDERLRDHAQELVQDINRSLGVTNDDDNSNDENEWEDEADDDEDDEAGELQIDHIDNDSHDQDVEMT